MARLSHLHARLDLPDSDPIVSPNVSRDLYGHDCLADLKTEYYPNSVSNKPGPLHGGDHLPSSVAPIARSKDGLPIGAQIVARPYGDRTTIAVAGLFEALHFGFVPPPGWR